ncbi:MAG TPA: MSEP-CTERM sorting domain-containing protein, partial [Spirochaetota bacterium]|nr:MSEP-CTERM sorting domain-containing protein [Spirochaetota bacterium]
MERSEKFLMTRLMSMILFFTVTVIPQTVLVLMNWHYYSIVAGEMKEYSGTVGSFFIGELTMIAVMIVLTIVLGTGRRFVGLIVPVMTLLISAAYLWIFTTNYSDLFPSVPSWILSREHLLYYQYVLVMPSTIYSIIAIALYRIGAFTRKKIILLGSCVIGIPLSWFIGIYAIMRLIRFGTVEAIMYPLLIMLLASTVVLYVLVFRLFVIVWRKINHRWEKRIRLALGLIFGLAAPVGGLIFNIFLPFPADFQYWQIYALAVINGIVLVFPVTNRPKLDTTISSLRIIMYPFTLYFFVVFIPFVPLSIPAIIAAGLGFLVLTPSFLLALHSLAIIEDLRNGRVPFHGRKFALAALLFVIPVVFTARAVADRYTLHSALDYVYEPDCLRDVRFKGSRLMLKNSIENL